MVQETQYVTEMAEENYYCVPLGCKASTELSDLCKWTDNCNS